MIRPFGITNDPDIRPCTMHTQNPGKRRKYCPNIQPNIYTIYFGYIFSYIRLTAIIGIGQRTKKFRVFVLPCNGHIIFNTNESAE